MNAELRSHATDDFSLLINGKLVPGATTFDVVNPATEEIVAACPRADLKQLNEAVAAAKAAYSTWKNVPIAKRRQLVLKLADGLESRMAELARLLTQEQGKPLGHAMFELAEACRVIRTFAAMDLTTEVLRETATDKIVRQRAPLGVVAAITPWNFPVLLLMLKVPPALLAGNTVVAKPAPTTPLSTLRFGEICAEVLPPGVVNVITDVNDLGGALTSHPDVAKVAFTGSTATGRKVAASVAPTLKHVTLELGGNDAAIVLDDVDPKEIAPKLFFGAMLNSGQICLAIKRAYVPDAMYDEVCNELGKLAERAIVGNGLEEGTEFGPIQNKMQYEKVKGYLEDARRRGRIVAGGAAPAGRGYFIRPTIVRDIPDDAALVREEQFGPILPVLRYKDVDEAIARANDSEYGLGATVWSSNTARAYEVASRIESGTVWVNKHLDLPPDIPFAGAKQSGLGIEMGQEGLEEFTQQRVINIAK
jgi:acyl-CoA reductase-like NAD-dependent aldehyde dehydrogenase